MARFDTVKDLLFLLGDGVYDSFHALDFRGDLLFDLCALPRTSPLVAAEKIKKRKFCRRSTRAAFELLIFQRHVWFPLFRENVMQNMTTVDKCYGVVYTLKSSGRERQGSELENALTKLCSAGAEWQDSVLYVLLRLSQPSSYRPDARTLGEKLVRDSAKVEEMAARYRQHSRTLLCGTSTSQPSDGRTTLLQALSRPAPLNQDLRLTIPKLSAGAFPSVEHGRPRQPPEATSDHRESFDSGIGSSPGPSPPPPPWAALSGMDLTRPASPNTARPRPYLTEAGPEVFASVHDRYMRGLCSLAGEAPVLTTPTSEQLLVRSVLLVLQATPTPHFPLNQLDCSFGVDPGLAVPGASHRACSGLLERFAAAGTHHGRLLGCLPLLRAAGLVGRGLAAALQTHLQQLLRTLVRVAEKQECRSLLGLRTGLAKELSELSFLAGLLGVDSTWPLAPENLPKGVLLLDGLYRAVLLSSGTPHTTLLLSLLRGALQAFLRFLQQWVCWGVCADLEEEFGLRGNPRALAARDHTYWVEGYVLTGQPFAPEFLPPAVAHQAFVCGKAFLLLKSCDPSNYVFRHSGKPPPLKAVFGEAQLNHLHRDWQEYGGAVRWAGDRWAARLLADKERRREEAQQAAAQARRGLLLGAAQARKLRAEEVAARAAEKKTELQRLKEQMERDRERRDSEHRRLRAGDRMLVAAAVQKEREEDERGSQARRLAREQLEAHYRALEAETALRERRAQWRLRRIRLNPQRRELLASEWSQPDLPPQPQALSTTADLLPSSPGLPATTTPPEVTAPPPEVKTSLPEVKTPPPEIETPPPEIETSPSEVKTLLSEVKTSPLAPKAPTVEVEMPPPDPETPPPAAEAVASGSRATPHPVQASPPTDQPMGSQAPPTGDVVQSDEGASSVCVAPPTGDVVQSDEGTSSVCVAPPTGDVIQSDEGTSSVCVVPSTRGTGGESVIQLALYPGSHDVAMVTRINTRGLEPPSTVQHLLYPRQEMKTGSDVTAAGSGIDWLEVERSCSEYLPVSYSPPEWGAPVAALEEEAEAEGEESTWEHHLPLGHVLAGCVTTPLAVQASLVNTAMVRYFMEELCIRDHFVALRRFLLLEDGEFGHALSNGLFEALSSLNPVVRLTSFAFLNPLLTAALQSSIFGDSIEANRLSFALTHTPTTINSSSSEALGFLELHYRSEWPCNLLLTPDLLSRYNRVLHFFLQLKRTAWALKDAFNHIKLCEGRGSLTAAQSRELLAYRYSMQHFVTVVQGYMANQVVQISWQEFQEDLDSRVHSLEDLYRCHLVYINKAIFRSLLSKKAAAVMKIIQEAFEHVHRFRAQLTAGQWHLPRHSASNYAALRATFASFSRNTQLLFMIVTKLVQRGYQPHLEDLLLRINFNGFFTQPNKFVV